MPDTAPWHVSGARTRLGGEPVLQIVGSDDRVLAYVLYGDGSTKQHIAAHADANLIAAAPPLYDTCASAPVLSKYHGQRGFEVERFIADYERWREDCRTVLARARGEG